MAFPSSLSYKILSCILEISKTISYFKHFALVSTKQVHLPLKKIFYIKIIGVTLVNKIESVSSIQFDNISYVYCTVYTPKVKFPSPAKYLTPFTLSTSPLLPHPLRSGNHWSVVHVNESLFVVLFLCCF